MVAQNAEIDNEWASLADLGEAEREAAMLSRYNELVDAEEAQRNARLRQMANAEYALPDAKLRLHTLSRMRTLLQMEPDRAKVLIGAYDTIMRQMPANAAMRRVGMVQTIVADFTAEEDAKLRELIPTIFGGAPRRRTGLEVERTGLAVNKDEQKRPFWAFWKK